MLFGKGAEYHIESIISKLQRQQYMENLKQKKEAMKKLKQNKEAQKKQNKNK
jgi:mannitol-specific phosphotransferase system IIBC component